METRASSFTHVEDVVAALPAPNGIFYAQAREFHVQLAHPRHALGVVETIGGQLSAITGTLPPPASSPAVLVVFAADHGVHDEQVSSWSQDTTARMVAVSLNGDAAVSAVTRLHNTPSVMVDMGIADNALLKTFLDDPSQNCEDLRTAELTSPVLLSFASRRTTGNICKESAMTVSEAEQAILAGFKIAGDLFDRGFRCLLVGALGTSSTTSSAALIAAVTDTPIESLAHGGSAGSGHRESHKMAVMRSALERSGQPDDPVELLAELGGFETAALVGLMLGAAYVRVPVLLDGLTTLAAALVASEMYAPIRSYFVASHLPAEPGAKEALGHLGLHPILDLSITLGEGTGAALAYPIVLGASAIMREMATFDEAGITPP